MINETEKSVLCSKVEGKRKKNSEAGKCVLINFMRRKKTRRYRI
jgi:hypothetical protein